MVNKKAEKYEDKCPILSNLIKDKRNKNVVGEDGEKDHVKMVAVDDQLEEAQADNNNLASSIDLTERGPIFIRILFHLFRLRFLPSVLVHRPCPTSSDHQRLHLTRMREREARNQPCKKYSANAILKFNDLLRRAGPNQSSTTKLNQLKLHETTTSRLSDWKHKEMSTFVLFECYGTLEG